MLVVSALLSSPKRLKAFGPNHLVTKVARHQPVKKTPWPFPPFGTNPVSLSGRFRLGRTVCAPDTLETPLVIPEFQLAGKSLEERRNRYAVPFAPARFDITVLLSMEKRTEAMAT